MNHHRPALRAAAAALATVFLLAACGGTDTAVDADADLPVSGLKKGRSTTVAATANPLPTSAPAPGVLFRESFGPGPDNLRPAGDKGELRSAAIRTTIRSFWVEYPGSKATAWSAPDGNQTWKFAAVGGYLDPYELPSPLQTLTQGAAISDWFDAITAQPTALLPFAAPAGAWSVSIEGYPAPRSGAYLALGLTASAATAGNLAASGLAWLSLKPGAADYTLTYELRLDGSRGALLASGVTPDLTWNQLLIRYDPAARQLSASVNGQSLGSFAVALAAPTHLAFEGVGLVDNFVVRSAP